MGVMKLSNQMSMSNYTKRLQDPSLQTERIQSLMKELEKANQTTKDGRYRIVDGKLVPAEGSRTLVPANMRGMQSNQASMEKTKKTRLEKKKLRYSYKKLSAAIRSSKTSANAHMVVSKARIQVSDLKKKRGSEEYDDVELEMAISHAMSIERVARKHEKNLRMEELAKRGENPVLQAFDPEALEEMEEGVEERISDLQSTYEDFEKSQKSERMLSEQEIEDFSEDMEKLLLDEMSSYTEQMKLDLFDMMEDLMAYTGEMDEEDIKKMERRHRSAEDRDIAKADMDYLKNYFEYLNSQTGAGMMAESGGAVTDFLA